LFLSAFIRFVWSVPSFTNVCFDLPDVLFGFFLLCVILPDVGMVLGCGTSFLFLFLFFFFSFSFDY